MKSWGIMGQMATVGKGAIIAQAACTQKRVKTLGKTVDK